ncbi:MAG: hypothetical protein WA673_13025, partial [Candidatus Acidiferrales bacterium]
WVYDFQLPEFCREDSPRANAAAWALLSGPALGTVGVSAILPIILWQQPAEPARLILELGSMVD